MGHKYISIDRRKPDFQTLDTRSCTYIISRGILWRVEGMSELGKDQRVLKFISFSFLQYWAFVECFFYFIHQAAKFQSEIYFSWISSGRQYKRGFIHFYMCPSPSWHFLSHHTYSYTSRIKEQIKLLFLLDQTFSLKGRNGW